LTYPTIAYKTFAQGTGWKPEKCEGEN